MRPPPAGPMLAAGSSSWPRCWPRGPAAAGAQENADCLACHGEKGFTTERGPHGLALRSEKAFAASVHGSLAVRRLPRRPRGQGAAARGAAREGGLRRLPRRRGQAARGSLHGKALKRGDPLAPSCETCHGMHDIRPPRTRASPVSPLKVPFTCGKCHQEGSRSSASGTIHQDHILENYSESIHGEGLLKKGLIVAANCASCHTAHNILPHTDPALLDRPRQHREDLHQVPRADRAGAPQGDPGRAVGEGGARAAGVRRLPPAAQGAEGLLQPGDGRRRLPALPRADRTSRSKDGRSMFVDAAERAALAARQGRLQPVPLRGERLAPAAVRDDHPEGRLRRLPRRGRAAVRAQPARQAAARRRPERARPARSATAATASQGRLQPGSPTFPTNVPQLCARCHREGEKAAVRYQGPQHEIIESYTESIHGKGLLKSGLTVTATCTNCHTAHGVLPRTDPASSVNRANVPADLRQVPPRHPGAVRAEHPPHAGRQDRQGAAGLQRLPQRAHDPARRRRGLQARDHAEVRPLPRRDRQDLLRHLPRQGHPARLHEDGQVLRLPRRPRHPAGRPTRARTSRARTWSRPARSATRARRAGSPAT